MSAGRALCLAGLLMASAGCRRGDPYVPPPPGTPARVQVTSNYGIPVEIYVLGSGVAHRAGLVHPGIAAEFNIPLGMVGNNSVEFQVRTTERGPTYRSGPMLLAPGRVVLLHVSAQLFNSTTTFQQ